MSSSRASRALRGDPRAWFGAGVVILLVLLALTAPVVARHDPVRIDLINQLSPPSGHHWLGTDVQGRDVWARLVYGATGLVNDTFLQLVRHETHRGLQGRALLGFWTGGKVYGYATVVEPNPPMPVMPSPS